MSGILNVLLATSGGIANFTATTVAAATGTYGLKGGATSYFNVAAYWNPAIYGNTIGNPTNAPTGYPNPGANSTYAYWSSGSTTLNICGPTIAATFNGTQVGSEQYATIFSETVGLATGTFMTYTSGASTMTPSIATVAAAGAVFTASSSGTTLTVTAVSSGTIAVGDYVCRGNLSYAYIASFGTGTGGAGTYNLSTSVTLGSATTYTGRSISIQSANASGVTTPSVPQVYGARILGIWGSSGTGDSSSGASISNYYSVYLQGNHQSGFIKAIKIGSTQLVGTMGSPVVDPYGNSLFTFTLTTFGAANLLTNGAAVVVS